MFPCFSLERCFDDGSFKIFFVMKLLALLLLTEILYLAICSHPDQNNLFKYQFTKKISNTNLPKTCFQIQIYQFILIILRKISFYSGILYQAICSHPGANTCWKKVSDLRWYKSDQSYIDSWGWTKPGGKDLNCNFWQLWPYLWPPACPTTFSHSAFQLFHNFILSFFLRQEFFTLHLSSARLSFFSTHIFVCFTFEAHLKWSVTTEFFLLFLRLAGKRRQEITETALLRFLRTLQDHFGCRSFSASIYNWPLWN